MQGAEYVLATGRPVLYMGGFSGNDPVVDAAQLVTDGDLRYVWLDSGGRGGPGGTNQENQKWVIDTCTAVTQFRNLYQCAD
jgi:4-amino-4-deoxy-L-arabinose transferase-like glycosyltransferase